MGLKDQSFVTIGKLLVVLLFIGLVYSAKPVPKCQAKPYYKVLPLIAQESAILNLDNIFDGYNLNFNLKGAEQWSKYITLNEKLKLQRKQIPDNLLIGLKSYHLQKVGNSWGTSFVALMQRSERTYLSYGFLSSNTSAPVINNEIKVESFENTTCFDAVIFPKADVMIVDCAVKLAQQNQQGFYYINQFYYFKISDGSRIKIIQNEMFIPFTSITRRKMQIYTERFSGNTYLLRGYMYDGVDANFENNTYIDVFMVSKPLEPWIVSVIDRTFLGMSTFRAADLRVYLSEIYVLDYTKGLHRIKINTEEDLIYSGFYEAKGFNRFAVYSNNLDDRFELALANNREVYQIDWSRIDDPFLITKYSLMPDSQVRQVFINERFVVVLSSSVDGSTVYNYTWILSRGDRTYTKAFLVIKHDTINTFVDINTDQSFLMVMDQDKLANYVIDQAIMTLTLNKDEDYIDKMMNFTIIAKSFEPNALTNSTLNCSFVFVFTLVEDNNRTMWQVGDAPAPSYNANYPGKVVIPMHQYALGPNITYRITEVKKGQLKKYKIYQQDQLKIHYQKVSPIKDLVFLRTQTINLQNQDILLIYTQDKQNTTYVTMCSPNHREVDVSCRQAIPLKTDGQINNWATTLFWSRYTLQTHHITAYTTTRHYNKVFIDDITTKQQVIDIDQGKGFAGNVTNVQTYGRYLFVILRYYKKIRIYDLQLVVDGLDQPICDITHTLMYQLGVKYFSPQSVETSQFYPNVLFIKTTDSIIVLDMNRECVPKLLAVLRPVQSTLVQFSFQITKSHLVVMSPPNSIIQYDLSRVYIKDIKLTKRYPTYGYKLPKNYDTDVSQFGNSMFVTMVSQSGDYQVFVYRAGYPAVSALYDVIDLYTYQPILIDASGNMIDYVTVFSGTELRIFRQYQLPVAEITNAQRNYQFYVEYYNVVTSVKLELISVSVINLPTKIAVNPRLNDIMNTKDLLYSGTNKISQINDTDWYDGNVLTIKSDCHDCANRVIVKNHIHFENSYELMPGLVDYDWNYAGGAFQAYDSLLQMNHAGSVRDFVHLPQTSNTICFSATAPLHGHYQVSACFQGNGVNLYLVTLLSHKGFGFTPYSSKAEQVLKVEAVNQLIMLVDTSPNPFMKTRTGGVFLYALNYDPDEDQSLQQLEYIDYTDFIPGSDKPGYVVNAQLIYQPQTKTYRLYITQLTKGVYQLDLKYDNYLKGISIQHVNYLNIPSLLNKIGMNPPYDATYQAVKVIEAVYDNSLSQIKDKIILTMGTYHTLMLEVVYGVSNHTIRSQAITKIFLRYSYYVVQNQIKYINGLIVVKQVLPEEYQVPKQKKSRQLISVYDVRAFPINHTKNRVPQLGLIGAHMIFDRNFRTFDFNLTFNASDPHDQPRVNMVIVHEFSNSVDQLSLHRNLSIFTKQQVDTQIIYLDLVNDFDLKKIRILLNGISPYPEWKLVTIILFSIIGFFLFLGALIVAIKRFKAYRDQLPTQQPQQRTSLLTEDVKTDRASVQKAPETDYRSSQKYDTNQNRSSTRNDNKYDTGRSESGRYDSGKYDKYDSGKYDKYDKYDNNKYDRYDSSKYDKFDKYDKYDKYDRYDSYDIKSNKNGKDSQRSERLSGAFYS